MRHFVTSRAKPVVGIIMGSESDLKVMKYAAIVLKDFLIPYEYARTARGRGLELIIAGAGGAAHLPGMVASLTQLPVIGVPVKLENLDGLDSLLSIVQMPYGVPVATVGINNAKNAGLLATRMLGLKYAEIHDALENRAQSVACKLTFDLEHQLEESGVADGK